LENRTQHHVFGAYEADNPRFRIPGSAVLKDLTKPVPVAMPHSPLAGFLGHCPSLFSCSRTASSCFALSSWITDVASRKCHALSDYSVVSSHWAKGALPALHFLYENYTSYDHYFASVPSSSYPNKMLLHAGRSLYKCTNESIEALGNPQQTIYSLMSEPQNSINWRIYFGHSSDTLFLEKQRDVWKRQGSEKTRDGHYRDIDQFYEDVKAGDLASYTTIEANYARYEVSPGVVRPQTDFHPDNSLASDANEFVAKVYNTLRSSPLWENTLFLITFDEWGGFADPVRPPRAPHPDGASGCYYNSTWDNCCYSALTRYGHRVPLLMASPWLKHQVRHEVADHTSVLAMLINNFQLTGMDLGERVKVAHPLAGFDFKSPNSTGLIPDF
jgi:phospholipase C